MKWNKGDQFKGVKKMKKKTQKNIDGIKNTIQDIIYDFFREMSEKESSRDKPQNLSLRQRVSVW